MPPERTIYNLSDVARSIQKTIAERYVSAYWIKAEMNKLNYYSHSGHCFPELLEKQQGKVVAQMRSTLWRDDYIRINELFIETLGQPLNDGVKILLLARVAFDPVYGLTLRILEIDPAYTLGDIEREKQETIKTLRHEGIFDQNKTVSMPLLPQRLAIISVETSKGLADFLEIIDKNPWGYRFFHMLFPSYLQGDKAIETITSQLNRIKKVKKYFDAVAIIRGGGDDIGLSCFNNYRLTKAIATFPLPVFSGIGHSTNETVTEMVTHYNAITPTKLAEFLVQAFHNYAVPVQEAEKMIQSLPKEIIGDMNERLKLVSRHIERSATIPLKQARHNIRSYSTRVHREVFHMVTHSRFIIEQHAGSLNDLTISRINTWQQAIMHMNSSLIEANAHRIKLERENLDNKENLVRHLNPVNILKRGYSITTLNGKALKRGEQVKPGDTISTKLYEGHITSVVKPTDPALSKQ